MSAILKKMKAIYLILVIVLMTVISVHSQSLWDQMQNQKDVLTLSVWFTAQDVDDLLSTPAGLDKAVSWCKEHGATKVYLEAFGRDTFFAFAIREIPIVENDFIEHGSSVFNNPLEFFLCF